MILCIKHMLFDRDLPNLALFYWKQIPSGWKRAFIAAFVLNLAVFFYDLAQFPLSDHDVGYLHGVPLLSGGRVGRWFAPAVQLLSGFAQIPVYTQCLAMAVFILAAMSATLLWFPQARPGMLFAAAAIITIFPPVTEFYYYHWMSLNFTVCQLFMIISIHLACHSRFFSWRIFLSVCLAVFALATYQSSIITWAVVWWGMAITHIISWCGSRIDWKKLIQTFGYPLLACCLACFLYSISLALYPLVGLSLDLYQFGTVKISSFGTRLFEWIQHSWEALFIPNGFFSGWIMFLLATIFFAGAIQQLVSAFRQKKNLSFPLLLFMILAFPPVAKIQFLVSSYDNWHLFRFIALGQNYMYAFFLCLLMKNRKMACQNLAFLLLILILPSMAIKCLDQQIRHKLYVDHDRSVLTRVLSQLENMPEFDPDRTYNLVQIGDTTPMWKNDKNVAPLDEATISQSWNPGFELKMLSPWLKLDQRLNESIKIRPDLMRKALEQVDRMQPYPRKNSILIDNDTIILLFDENAIETAKENLKKIENSAAPTPEDTNTRK